MTRRKKTVFLAAALVLIAGVLAGVWMMRRGGAPAEADQAGAEAVVKPAIPDIWFDDLTEPLEGSDTEMKALVQAVADAVRGGGEVELPDALFAGDREPRMIFLSITDGNSAARIVLGVGQGILTAAQNAVTLARKGGGGALSGAWIKVDIVRTQSMSVERPVGSHLILPPSLYGFALPRETTIALLPEELISNDLVDSLDYLNHDKLSEYLSSSPYRQQMYERHLMSGAFPVTRFECDSYFSETAESAVVRLYRGHKSREWISSTELLDAATRAGVYLQRMTYRNGRFAYVYHPATNSIPPSYNIVRHAGTVYSMYELLSETGDPYLKKAADRALEYLLQHIRPAVEADGTLCVVSDNNISLGGTALALVALVEQSRVSGSTEYLDVMRGLGRWIVESQDETGVFTRQKQSWPDGSISSWRSVYYPGEAILALIRLYSVDPQKKWLTAADKAALYLIEVRDGQVPDDKLPHDHWLLYGVNELYRELPRPQFRRHAMRLAMAIVRSQNRSPGQPDWLGSFREPPRSTPTATRMEGLAAAYLMARDMSFPEAPAILEALKLGTGFQLQMQFGPHTALYFPKPYRALGGFRHSFGNSEIRIDYVQHNISSLLMFYRISKTALNAMSGSGETEEK